MKTTNVLLDLEPNAAGNLVARPKRFERGYPVDTLPVHAEYIAIYREIEVAKTLNRKG